MTNPRNFVGGERKEFERIMLRILAYEGYEPKIASDVDRALAQANMCGLVAMMNQARYAQTPEEVKTMWAAVHRSEHLAFDAFDEVLGNPSKLWSPK